MTSTSNEQTRGLGHLTHLNSDSNPAPPLNSSTPSSIRPLRSGTVYLPIWQRLAPLKISRASLARLGQCSPHASIRVILPESPADYHLELELELRIAAAPWVACGDWWWRPCKWLEAIVTRCPAQPKTLLTKAPGHNHRNMTPKSVMPTTPSCIDVSWRSTTLSLRKKLISSTAILKWCHVHFSSDSYICRVIWPSKNLMELFFNAKFNFKYSWNCDWATSHHKHPVCQYAAGYTEKLTNVWSKYLECIGLLVTGTGDLR